MLIYKLEIRNSSVYIQLQQPGSKRILYLDTLQSIAPKKDLAAIQTLIKFHLRANAGKSPDTLPFQEIALPPNQSIEVMKQLLATGNLHYRGQVLQSAKLPLIWKGDQLSESAATIYPLIGDIPLEQVNALFPGWAIAADRWIEVQTQVPWKWVEVFQTGPKTLEGVQKKRFCEDNPDIFWSETKVTAKRVVTPIPHLVLTDKTGSFANLLFDYPGIGSIAYEDLAPHVAGTARLKKDEAGFEKDLLEAGFQRKIVGTSRYYCPGDKTRETLKLLLEVGWRCSTLQNKTVVLQSRTHIDIKEAQNTILVTGTLRFQEKSVALKSSLKSPLFVELDGTSIGLIDPGSIPNLPEGTWEEDMLSLPKPRLGELMPLLEKQGVNWSETLRNGLVALQKQECEPLATLSDKFLGKLLPYQEKGVAWLQFLRKQGFGALLSDEMGLGKTVQVLAFFSQLRTNLPILIVAPTSLIFNWVQEIAKFWKEADVYVHAGQERLKTSDAIQGKAVVLTSYALLRIDQEIFAPVFFEAVALDESQMIKSSKSMAASAAFRLKANFRVAITGTPIENRPDELWSQFQFLMPDLLGDLSSFLATSTETKRLRVKPFILRRRKADVELQLPPKMDQPLWIEMSESQQKIYAETLLSLKPLAKRVQTEGIQQSRLEILTAILRLRQICADQRLVGGEGMGAKAEALLSMAEEWAASGKKALVFSQFTSFLRLISKDLRNIGIEPLYLDGSTPAPERGEVVRRFQEEEKPHLFLLSLKAGGVGLNLTAAQNVLLLEPWWNEAVESQAIDRAYRIGQKNALFVTRALTPNAIEEKMLSIKGRKMAFAEEILSGSEEGWDTEDLLELITAHQI